MLKYLSDLNDEYIGCLFEFIVIRWPLFEILAVMESTTLLKGKHLRFVDVCVHTFLASDSIELIYEFIEKLPIKIGILDLVASFLNPCTNKLLMANMLII
jgi:hypothetical protein